MLLLPNLCIKHIPKCGGTWVRHCLQDSNITFIHRENSLDPTTLPVYGFIRNPWSWYVSWYNFCHYGSNIMTGEVFDLFKIAENGRITFDTFIRNLCTTNMTYRYKLIKASNYFGKNSMEVVHLQLVSRWLNTDKSFLEFLYDEYLSNAVFVGRLESIKPDLINILNNNNLITKSLEEKIYSMPTINIGKKINYKDYYTKDTRMLVQHTHQNIICRHKYNFEGNK